MGGVSAARQAGLDNATGVYTIHADPDDWVDSTMIEELVGKAQEADADMVICDFYESSDKTEKIIRQDLGQNLTAYSVLKMILLQQLHGSCCNKLIKRACYNGIGFFPNDLCILEDSLFNLKVLANDIRVVYFPKAFYHYRVDNILSICHSISDRSFNLKIKAVNCIEEFCLNEVSEIGLKDFIPIKKNILFDAFRTKRWSQIGIIYPDLTKQMIKEGTPYRFLFPVTSCIAIALRGYPALGWYIYSCNIKLIDIAQKIKRIYKHCVKNFFYCFLSIP